jgi:hypothetical protein
MKRFLVALALAIFALATLAFGQTTDAILVGTVSDATGALVPNATVEITHTATGVKTSTKTNADGTYRFNNVPVGHYNLVATAAGFSATNLKGIDVQLSKTSTANITMQVGTVATSVDVSDVGTVIDTTTAQVQTAYDSQTIVNLPIIENANANYGALQLSLLSAGVASNGGVGQGTGPSVGGQRPMNNNFMIEGVDNNNKTVTGPLVYVPTEATAEFTLLQNQFGSEFGHSTGGQFNTIIKGGTNNFHGSAYEYFQNRNLNALDSSFTNVGIYSLPRYDQNKLGGSFGGPIKRDKLFFFGNFEYMPLGEAYTPPNPIWAPTASGFATLDKMAGISQTNYGIFKKFVPVAPFQDGTKTTSVNGAEIPIGVLPISGSSFNNFYSALGSVDYNLSSSDQVRGRIIWNKTNTLDTNANLPAFWTNLPQRFYLVTASEYHTFSPSLTNELRLGYNRFSQYYTITGDSYPGLDAFPNIQFDNDLGLQLGPDPNAAQFTVQNTYQLVDNMTWTKGKHTLKFGFDGRNAISPQHFIQRERGDYDYDNLQEFLMDRVPSDQAQRNLGSTGYYGNQWATYLYANDSWRVKKNVTVNLGIRWERTTVPTGMGLQSLNAISTVPGLIDFREPKTFNKAFAPRVGIAYSPGSSGRTSIRAGFGMAYDVLFDNIGSTTYPPQLSSTYDAVNFKNLFPENGPFLANGGIKPGSLSGGGDLSQADARQASSSYIPDQVLPTSIQWNVGVQHVFHNDYTFEARYLGSRGYHLITQTHLNSISRVSPTLPGLPTYLQAPSQAQLDSLGLTLDQIKARPGFAPQYAAAGFNGSAITAFMPWGSSLYNGLALQLNRRFSNGLSFQGAYTWSHNLDNSTATHFSTVLSPRRPQDYLDLRNEWGASPLDRRQRLTFSWMYDAQWMKNSTSWAAKNLVGNWRIVGTYTAESGEWVTPQSGADANLNADTVDRTILNPAGTANIGSDVTALKNSAGATVAYLAKNPNARYIRAQQGTYPTAGRNTLEMPGINNFDLSIAKKFNFRESKYFEIRGDASNAFNHPQYTAGYVNTVRLTSQTNSNIFLVPSAPQFADWSNNFSSNSRSLQIVAKFVF